MNRLLLLLTLAAAGCLGAAKSLGPLPAGGVHVLFIGNSLTYEWDLPGTVAFLASMGGDTVRVSSQTGPNLALIDHLNGGTQAVAAIKSDSWNYVILQQGPTPAGICRDSLVLWTQMFDPLIRAQGAKTAVFQTWPLGGPVWYTNIGESFRIAAAAVNGTLMPVGDAWLLALTESPGLQLHGPDGLHPSRLGTYLAALVIYERVTGHDARNLPARAVADGQDLNQPVELVRLLQRAAHQANLNAPPPAGVSQVASLANSC